MGAFILFVENEVATQAAAPTAVSIESTLRALPVNGNREFKLHAGLPGDASFVGNARVTRIARLGWSNSRVTRASWLYQWPDPPGATPEQNARLYSDVVRNMISNVQTAMPAEWNIDGVTQVTGWKAPVIVPYSPSANGSVEWWQSPTGSIATATRDTFDLNQQVGTMSTIDNPVGPTTNRAPDFDPFHTNNPDSAFNKLLDLATTALWVGGGIALLVYVVGPLVGMIPKPTRANPSQASLFARQVAAIGRMDRWAAMPAGKRQAEIESTTLAELKLTLEANDPNGDYRTITKAEAVELMLREIES